MSAGCYSRNLILGILCGGKATLTEYLEPNCYRGRGKLQRSEFVAQEGRI